MINVGFIVGPGDELYSFVTGIDTKEKLQAELASQGEAVVSFVSQDDATMGILEALCGMSNGDDDSFCSQFEDFLLKVFEAGRQYGLSNKEVTEKPEEFDSWHDEIERDRKDTLEQERRPA